MQTLVKSALSALLAFSSLIHAAQVDQPVNCSSLVNKAPAEITIQVYDESTAKVPERVELLKKAACQAVVGAAHLQAIAPADAVGFQFVVVDDVLGRSDNASYEGSDLTKVGIGLLDKGEVLIRFAVAHEVGHLVHWDKFKGKLWGVGRAIVGATAVIGAITAVFAKKNRLVGLALAAGGATILLGSPSACASEKMREIAADDFAVRAMHATGLTLATAKNQAIQVMGTNKQGETACEWWPSVGDRLTAHPSTDQRIAAIKAITAAGASSADNEP